MKNPRDLAILSLIVCAALAGCAKKQTPSSAQPSTSDATNSSEPISALPGDGSSASDSDPNLPTIYFEYDQSTLSQTARTTLQSIAANLKSASSRVTIEGHCDERGSNEYNLALGENRARAVRDYLRKLGVPSDKLNTVSFGEEKPADSGQGESSWVKNRRAELVLGN